MVVTMLEARVDPERADDLSRDFEASAARLPPAIVESYLLRAPEGDTWRIVTFWGSRDRLDDYRASVDVPKGVSMFRAVGAEPTLSIFEVAARVGR